MLESLLLLLSRIPSPVKFWREYGLGVLGLVCVFAFSGWQLTNNALDVKTKALNDEKAAHTRDITSFRAAQDEANRHAEQVRQNLLKESQASAKQADTRYSSLLSEYRTNLLRYQANQGSTSGPSNSQLPTPESSDRSSPSPVVPVTATGWLNIKVEDAQVCAVNTARLQAVHDWAVSLPK